MKSIIISVLLLLVIGCIPEKFSASPDGQVVFYRDSAVYITNKDISLLNEIPISETGKVAWVEWSPDGKKLLYTTFDGTDKNSSLYSIDRDGRNKKKLIEHNELMMAPEWSPDMKYISYTKGDDKGNLYLYEIATGKNRMVAEDTGIMYKWLPDSKALISVRKNLTEKLISDNSDKISNELFSIDVDSYEKTHLASGFFSILTALDYHPPSRSIIFSSGAVSLPGSISEPLSHPKYYIHSFNMNDKSIKRISDEEPVVFFCLSPKKEKILYIAMDDTSVDNIDQVLHGTIYVMDIGGKNKIKVGKTEGTRDRDNVFVPFWASEDVIGYYGEIKENDKTDEAIWLYNLKTNQRTNFTKFIEQAQQNKKK